ncbi:MAG TPA: hypothetical protein VHZ03_54075 [Trebonia sp.]|nr:hypothetical protein [Trebonia sp.]
MEPDAAAPGVARAPSGDGRLHIYAKLGVSDRAAAVAEAFNRDLLARQSRR